ncbi:MAG TPA: substrate-binding domain-containing protein [Solirubrobacteraceae bacterium]|nr:substrate-binding domain-containing protein [Solirubrobacteraceae bacterium]
MKVRSTLLALVTAVAVAGLTAGCGSSSSSSTTTASAAANTGTSSTAAASSSTPSWLAAAQSATSQAEQVPTAILQTPLGSFKPKSSGTIFHVACNLALEGCTKLANGIKAGTLAIGYQFKLCNGGTTANQINECFTQAIAAHPTAIVVNGIGESDAANSFAAAAKAGVPIVGSFTGDSPGINGVVTEVAGNTCAQQAKTVANAIIADSKGKANVLWVGTNTYTCNIQRQQGFLDQMKTCPTCTVKTLSFAIDAITSQLPSQLQSALQSNPNLTYVVGTFDAVALAATQAIRQAGKADSIKVAGFDGDAPDLQLVKEGSIQMWDDVTGGGEPGYAAVDAAARHAVNKQVPKVTDITTMLVTKSNYSQIAPAYQGPSGYEQQFKQLWGKG